MKKKVYLVQCSYRKMDRSVVKGSSMIINCTLNVPMLIPTIPADWEMDYCLENFTEIDFTNDAPVVFISTTSSDMVHAYHVAQRFRELGKKVFFGGFSDTMSVSVMKLVCNSIYWGNPDAGWMKKMLEDAVNDSIKPEYQCGINIDFAFDYSVFEGEKIDHLIVVSSVGCRHRCDYCQHTVQYDGIYKLREIGAVIEDMRSVKRFAGIAAFRDSNFYNDKEYTRALCERIIEEKLDMKWGAQCPITIGNNPELLKLMYRAGCRALFIGYESLIQENLKSVSKPSLVKHYKTYTKNIRDAGIYVVGYFVFGWDHDSKESFSRVYDFAIETRLSLPIINMYTPVPGTRFYDRLVKEGRVDLPAPENFVDEDLIFSIPCNSCHYVPLGAPADELEEEFMKLYRRFTSPRQILKRSIGNNIPESIALLKMNLNLRFERRKLDRSLRIKNNGAEVHRPEPVA
jgi:hypothetical protein